jgi:hypothetical protein
MATWEKKLLVSRSWHNFALAGIIYAGLQRYQLGFERQGATVYQWIKRRMD